MSFNAYYLVYRYAKAKQSPPQLLYSDRDCVSISGKSKCARLFVKWDQLQVGRNCYDFVSIMYLVGAVRYMALYEKAITREELAHHCRRRTRGAEVTLQLIEELLLAFGTATDSYGVPLFGEQMVTIWKKKRGIFHAFKIPQR